MKNYKIGTKAYSGTDDVSRPSSDIFTFVSEDDKSYYGYWLSGVRVENIRFPKMTSRDLRQEEYAQYFFVMKEDKKLVQPVAPVTQSVMPTATIHAPAAIIRSNAIIDVPLLSHIPDKDIKNVARIDLAKEVLGLTTITNYYIKDFLLLHKDKHGDFRFVVELINEQKVPSSDGSMTLNIHQVDDEAKKRVRSLWAKMQKKLKPI